MPRKKKIRHSGKKRSQRTTNAQSAIDQGHIAFEAGNYTQAATHWDRALKAPSLPEEKTPVLQRALAEAWFRAAVNNPENQPTGWVDLIAMRKALAYAPDDPLYRYFMALAHHRDGSRLEAIELYHGLLTETPAVVDDALRQRVKTGLAQALIAEKKALSRTSLWEHLTTEEQQTWHAIEAVVRSKAKSTREKALHQAQDGQILLPIVWQAALLLSLNPQTDQEEVERLLRQAADDPPNDGVLLVINNYLGRADAAKGDYTSATRLLETVDKAYHHLRDFYMPDFHGLYNTVLTATLEQGLRNNDEKALALVTIEIKNADPELSLQVMWAKGNMAAAEGDWETALAYWTKASWVTTKVHRGLIFNLALANQNVGEYWEAAEDWRAVLRRRPRKADHPDALTETQVARIWQYVAENYARAGEYEEAIVTYKNAIKKSPNNLALRLKLVESYQEVGRWRAAENELGRILDKDPRNVPALILQAEAYHNPYFFEESRARWLYILEIEPENPIARQQLAGTYLDEVAWRQQWRGERDSAEELVALYREGLNVVPNHPRLTTGLARALIDLGALDEAQALHNRVKQAHKQNLGSRFEIMLSWLEAAGTLPEIDIILQQEVDALIADLGNTPPGNFYLDLADLCEQAEYPDLNLQLLNHLVNTYSQDPKMVSNAAIRLSELGEVVQALTVLRNLQATLPADNIDIHAALGCIYHDQGQAKTAERHWRIARKAGEANDDHAALFQLDLLRNERLGISAPPTDLANLFSTMPPQLVEQLLANAPPHIAEMMRNNPEMLIALLTDLMDASSGGNDPLF